MYEKKLSFKFIRKIMSIILTIILVLCLNMNVFAANENMSLIVKDSNGQELDLGTIAESNLVKDYSSNQYGGVVYTGVDAMPAVRYGLVSSGVSISELKSYCENLTKEKSGKKDLSFNDASIIVYTSDGATKDITEIVNQTRYSYVDWANGADVNASITEAGVEVDAMLGYSCADKRSMQLSGSTAQDKLTQLRNELNADNAFRLFFGQLPNDKSSTWGQTLKFITKVEFNINNDLNKFNVTYKVEGDAPSSFEGTIPEKAIYDKNAKVTVAAPLTTKETTKDGKKGTWSFSWNKEDFEITEDTEIIGTWTFTEDKKPTPTPTPTPSENEVTKSNNIKTTNETATNANNLKATNGNGVKTGDNTSRVVTILLIIAILRIGVTIILRRKNKLA